MSEEKKPMEASAMKAKLESAGLSEEHAPAMQQAAAAGIDIDNVLQKGVAAGFDFGTLLQLILKALSDPELLALIKKLFGG